MFLFLYTEEWTTRRVGGELGAALAQLHRVICLQDGCKVDFSVANIVFQSAGVWLWISLFFGLQDAETRFEDQISTLVLEKQELEWEKVRPAASFHSYKIMCAQTNKNI